MEKLRCLEEEIRRSRSRHRRSVSRHRDGRSRSRRRDRRPRSRRRDGRSRSGRYSRRNESWDSNKENGERIAVENRRTSHSRHERSYPRSASRSITYDSDGKSGERHLREASHSSRERSVAEVRGLDKEGGERNPRGASRPSPPMEISVKQVEDKEEQLPTELAEATLGLLGDDPSRYDQRGPDIHVAVAERWSKILQDGLPKDQKRDLQGKYPTIGNCPLTKAPKINPEIKSALSQLAIKKDAFQYAAQNQLGAGINAIGAALTEILIAEGSTDREVDTQKLIERLADAGRILSDLHHEMSKTRKSFIIPGLNSIVKNIANDSPIDAWLFGEKFAENLKAAKSMEKSSKDLTKPSGYQRNFGNAPREGNRRFASSYSRPNNFLREQQSEKLNWHRPSGASHRGTQRKGPRPKDFRNKDNRQHKE